jgi:hypothetical protein
MVPTPTWIYHITNLSNLRSIITSSGLYSNVLLQEAGTDYTDVAYANVQSIRATCPVPCGPGGYLHDYVPFYFAPRSPMLNAIHYGTVKGYSAGQRPILHLLTTVQEVRDSGVPFVFTDGHGIVAITEYFDDLGKLDRIDWAIMEEKYWRDTPEDPDRKRRRQAEFLVHEQCPWSLIRGIGVYDDEIAEQVRAIITNVGHEPVVRVRRHWYY